MRAAPGRRDPDTVVFATTARANGPGARLAGTGAGPGHLRGAEAGPHRPAAPDCPHGVSLLSAIRTLRFRSHMCMLYLQP
ncbi:hypothetical protein GCM10017752_56860 [Streptomyces roseoviridis]